MLKPKARAAPLLADAERIAKSIADRDEKRRTLRGVAEAVAATYSDRVPCA